MREHRGLKVMLLDQWVLAEAVKPPRLYTPVPHTGKPQSEQKSQGKPAASLLSLQGVRDGCPKG